MKEEEMDDKGNQKEPNGSRAGVYELPGEPAVVINGVPDITSCDSTTSAPIAETHGPSALGEWFEGREVRKWFMGRFYSGSVTEFDKKNGWFRVLYEDGDSEDLDWHELEEVFLPLDVTVPLKALAQSVVKKIAKSAQKDRKDEKHNSRAERSGTVSALQGSESSQSEDLKRKARAERFGMPTPSTTADEDAKKKARRLAGKN